MLSISGPALITPRCHNALGLLKLALRAPNEPETFSKGVEYIVANIYRKRRYLSYTYTHIHIHLDSSLC
jgi:hypothetical protein